MTTTLATQLNPRRFSGMSGKMAAIVGCIIGEQFTSPAIAELHVTSDGFVMARNDGDIGANAFIGALSDLKGNWERLLDAAELSPELRKEAEHAFNKATVS